MPSPILYWFRRDLRLADNPALHHALEQGAPVCAVYLHSPEEEAPWAPGAASRWWLHQSLLELAERLQQQGLRLHCLRGPALTLLPELARRIGAREVVWNCLYEPHLHARDQRLAEALDRQGIAHRSFSSGYLFEPGEIRNGQAQPYRVFTPFWRNARQRIGLAGITPPHRETPWPDGWDQRPIGDVVGLGLLDSHPWHHKLHPHWQPGEIGARQQLDRFLAGGITHYDSGRDRPDREGTSRLSPHLHFGEISPQAILVALGPPPPGEGSPAEERFLAELGWREFARDLLWHYPHTQWYPLDRRFGETFWGEGAVALRAWQRGETGIDLVDAGMRELWETGWMHNRVRMVVASFLTKNLGLHWRQGALWFWDTLVDADLASNSLGWQWVAGCGADAAPYYRIFNPDTQAARFDPEGKYRRRWLTEALRPQPLVDLGESRRAALERYRIEIGR